MNIQPTPSQLRHHEAHKAAQQRLWGKPKPAKPQLVIVARNDRPPVDASYHMVLYRSYQANLRANFSLSGSFDFKQGADYQPYATEIHFEEGETPPKTMKKIAAEVLTGFPGISLDAVKGKRRLRSIVAARQMVIYEIARQLPGKSYPEIGRFIGKDHTTILHAVQKLRAIHEQDADGIMWLERKNKQQHSKAKAQQQEGGE